MGGITAVTGATTPRAGSLPWMRGTAAAPFITVVRAAGSATLVSMSRPAR